jgi:hypothetical protein
METPPYLTTADFSHGLLTGLVEQDRIRSLAWPDDQTIKAVRAAITVCQQEGIKLECYLAASVAQTLVGAGEQERRLIRYHDPHQFIIQHHELGIRINRSVVPTLLRQRMAVAFDEVYNDGHTP